MVEVAILTGVVFILAGIGLLVWRLLRGPAGRPAALVVRIAILALVIAPLVGWSAWRLSKSRTFQLFGQIVPRVETPEPLVALTFDDGPTARFTDEVLAILREEGVPATFFAVGKALERSPQECQKIVAEGHELGNHSYSHPTLVLEPFSTVRQEIEDTDRLIRACGYDGDIHFRAPNGKKLILLPLYLSSTGRKTISWDVEPESYREIAGDAGQIAQHVLQETQPGSIILLHVMYKSREQSRAALPAIIRGLKEKGYRFVTVSELLNSQ
jgi:peptidoglycan/xylan/chitin deacetylase (PgdA/CDA1 family)